MKFCGNYTIFWKFAQTILQALTLTWLLLTYLFFSSDNTQIWLFVFHFHNIALGVLMPSLSQRFFKGLFGLCIFYASVSTNPLTKLSSQDREIVNPLYAEYVGGGFDTPGSGLQVGCAFNNVKPYYEPIGVIESSSTDYLYVESAEEAKSFLEKLLTAGITVGSGSFKAEASFSNKIVNSIKASSKTVTLLVAINYSAAAISLDSADFNERAMNLIKTGNVKGFQGSYGSAFSKTVMLGANLIVKYTCDFSSKSELTSSDVRAALKVKYGAFTGTASGHQIKTMEKTLSNTNITSQVISTGGLWDNSVVTNKEEFDSVYKQFINYYKGAIEWLHKDYKGNKRLHITGRLLMPYTFAPVLNPPTQEQVPAFLNPSKFVVRDLRVTQTSPKVAHFQWRTPCDFHHGFYLYYITSNSPLPILAASIDDPSRREYTWDIPYSVPVSDGIWVYIVPRYMEDLGNTDRHISLEEFSQLYVSGNSKDPDWLYRGQTPTMPSHWSTWVPAFKVYRREVADSVPLYVFYNSELDKHWFTTNYSFPISQKFICEDIQGWVKTKKSEETIPLHVFEHPSRARYLSTKKEAPGNAYEYKGIECFVIQ